MPGISHWMMMLHGWVDRLKLRGIKSRYLLRTTNDTPQEIRYTQNILNQHSQHTHNIQINKVIGEMKNMSFILWKKLNGLFGQPNIN